MAPDDRAAVVRGGMHKCSVWLQAALLSLLLMSPAQAQFLSEFSKHSHKDPFDYGDNVLTDVVRGCEPRAAKSVAECMKIFGPLPTEYAGERKSAIKVVFPFFMHWATASTATILPDPISLNYYCTGAASLTCTLVNVSTPDPFPEFRCSSSRDARCASAKSKFEKSRKHLHVIERTDAAPLYPAPCFTYCGPSGVAIADVLSQGEIAYKDLAGVGRH